MTATLPRQSAPAFVQGSSNTHTQYGQTRTRLTTTAQFANVPTFLVPTRSRAPKVPSREELSREELEEMEDDPMAEWDAEEDEGMGSGSSDGGSSWQEVRCSLLTFGRRFD